MTAQHTPGPWTVGSCTWNEDGNVCYELRGIKRGSATDARLIAAAPELLDALKDILQEMEPNSDMRWAGSRAKVCDKARAAIAKATGGAK